MKILFYHSTKRMNTKGRAPIYGRISLNGDRSDFSTGIFVCPGQFHNEMVTAPGEAAEIANVTLTALRNKANSVYLDYRLKEKPISAHRLMEIVTGKTRTFKNFSEVCTEYLGTIQADRTLERSTVSKHETFYDNLCRFLEKTRQKNICLEEFDYSNAERYRAWLQQNVHNNIPGPKGEKRPASQDHYARHLLFCKNAFRYAKRAQYINFSPLDELQTPRDRKKPARVPNIADFEKFSQARWTSRSYTVAQDLFLYQVGIGILYGDLEKHQVEVLSDHREWVMSDREKNDMPYRVPLFDASKAILEKYNGHLPRLANQVYNRYLKEMCAILDIPKMTTKMARKIFATTKWKEGWSVPSISFMMGHGSTRTTEENYIAPSVERIMIEGERRTMPAPLPLLKTG